MIRWSSDRVLWLAAWLSLAFGIVLSIRTFAAMPAVRKRLDRAVENVRRLKEIEAEFTDYEMARDTFEKLPVKHPPPLEALLTEAFSDTRRSELPEAESIRLNGWVLRRQEISWTEVSLAKVMQFVRAIETRRPPWRLVSCEIRASPRQPGTGHVVAVFESLEKIK